MEPSGVTSDPSAGARGSDIRDLITRKRRGDELTAHDLHRLVALVTTGDAVRTQLAALLTAGVLRGFSEGEAVALTDALTASGATLRHRVVGRPTVDKHSTGGVADSVTLVLAPLLAACGTAVVKLSGRALGHTGGTIDKLESVPGLRTTLSAAEVAQQVAAIGVVVAGAGPDLAPADRALYALRDEIAMVDDTALIASSVMSKKLAAGADHLVLDVKAGDGALLPDPRQAVELARLCVRIGEANHRRTAALVTDMSQPLGRAVGDALEVREAVRVLRGETSGALLTVVVELAETALRLVGASDPAAMIQRALAGGAALETFAAMVEAQGGDPRVTDDPDGVLPAAPAVREVVGGRGTVRSIACRGVGALVRRLADAGGGDATAHAVGLELSVAVGDTVEDGQPIAWVHASSERIAADAAAAMRHLVEIGEGPVTPPPLVHARI